MEGHQFAIFGFKLTSDFRYIVSVSNKFITWDVATSDLVREVYPDVTGLMMDIVLSPDCRFAAAYTNNSQTILLNTMISEFVIIDNPFGEEETVQGLNLLDTLLIILGQFTWCVYSTSGKLVEKKHVPHSQPILSMFIPDISSSISDVIRSTNRKVNVENDVSLPDYSLLRWSGNINDSKMVFEDYKNGVNIPPLNCHGGIVLNKKQSKVRTCADPETNNVSVFAFKNDHWLKKKEFCDNPYPIIQLALSLDETYLIGTFTDGFILWKLTEGMWKASDGARKVHYISTSV